MLLALRLRAPTAIALLALAGACSSSSSPGAADASAVDDATSGEHDGTVDTEASSDDAAGGFDAALEASPVMDGASDASAPDAAANADATVGTPDASGINDASAVDASDAEAGAPAPVTINACPGSLDATTAGALQAGGAVDPAMAWLYPYGGTVFPRGIPAPTLQWSPQTGGTSAVLLHLHSQLFDYRACFGSTSAAQLTIPASAWTAAAAQSLGTSDPLVVELTTSYGTTVSGPIRQTWTLATGPLAGTVYYNTYGSKLVPGQNSQNGAVMKVSPGASAPTAFLYTTGNAVFPFGPCVSCHAVSANGGVLAAEQEFYPSTDPLNGKGSMSFGLSSAASLDPTMPTASTLNDSWGLSGVYPDGSLLLTSGEPGDSTTTPLFPGVSGNNPGMIGPKKTAMYNTATGASVAFTGLSAQYAMMPTFSPDGKHVVYNDYDAGSGHTLRVMDFNVSTKVFSGGTAIFHDDTLFPGWPAFTPDGQSVVFALGNSNNFATETPPTASPTFSSQLYVVSASGGTAQRLDATSGLVATGGGAGGTYLPGGAQDENLDFYPSLSPVASGGYFWVYFTSRRSYGNLYNSGPGGVASKAIWAAAIDIAAPAGHDPSHPAFYLPGQELGSGNFRGTSSLSACKGNGTSCANGFDCCAGACTAGACAAPASCSKENDRCTNASDCCDAADRCIGGYCASVAP